MNRKIAIGAFLIAIIALALASYFIQNQISELQAQNDELRAQIREQLSGNYTRVNIRITAVNVGEDWQPMVGMVMLTYVNVTVRNNDAYAVKGLTVAAKWISPTGQVSETPSDAYIDLLQAGESREVETQLLWAPPVGNSTCVYTVMLNGFVLDEWMEPFSI
jgi:hypothetical protein